MEASNNDGFNETVLLVMPVGLYLKIIWSLDNRTKNSGMVRIQGEKIVPEASELFFFFSQGFFF